MQRITDFGAFVEIMPGTDGLLHVSEIAHYRVKDVRDELKEGQQVLVKVINIDPTGKIRLSRKALITPEEGGAPPASSGGGGEEGAPAGAPSGDRPPRGDAIAARAATAARAARRPMQPRGTRRTRRSTKTSSRPSCSCVIFVVALTVAQEQAPNRRELHHRREGSRLHARTSWK